MIQPNAPESAGSTKAVFVQVYRATRRQHMDAAGQFSIPSHKGNQYILVMYDEDFKFIHTEPLRSRDKHDVMCQPFGEWITSAAAKSKANVPSMTLKLN